MEIYGSITFQSSVSTYGFVKLVMEIYGSVSEAGELGLSPTFKSMTIIIIVDIHSLLVNQTLKSNLCWSVVILHMDVNARVGGG